MQMFSCVAPPLASLADNPGEREGKEKRRKRKGEEEEEEGEGEVGRRGENESKKWREERKGEKGAKPDGNLHLQQYNHTLIAAYIVDNCTHKIMVTPSLIPYLVGRVWE